MESESRKAEGNDDMTLTAYHLKFTEGLNSTREASSFRGKQWLTNPVHYFFLRAARNLPKFQTVLVKGTTMGEMFSDESSDTNLLNFLSAKIFERNSCEAKAAELKQ